MHYCIYYILLYLISIEATACTYVLLCFVLFCFSWFHVTWMITVDDAGVEQWQHGSSIRAKSKTTERWYKPAWWSWSCHHRLTTRSCHFYSCWSTPCKNITFFVCLPCRILKWEIDQTLICIFNICWKWKWKRFFWPMKSKQLSFLCWKWKEKTKIISNIYPLRGNFICPRTIMQ